MNEHKGTPTSESVEEAMSKAIEPVLNELTSDRPQTLAERIAGLGTPQADEAIPMPPPERSDHPEDAIAMSPPDHAPRAERAIPMPPPAGPAQAEQGIPMPPPERPVHTERATPMSPPDRPVAAERFAAAARNPGDLFHRGPAAQPSYATPTAPMAAAPGMPSHVVLAPTALIPRVPNRVYEHLVESDDDVIGLIAYSLYKHDKRLWLMTWRDQHGVDATGDQIEAFVNGQMTSGQRDRYRTAARQVLDSYAMVAVDMEKPQITREAVAGRVEAAARKVETQGRWWRQIPGVVIGAILSVGILIGVIAILVALDFDVGSYLGVDNDAAPAGRTNVVP